MFSIFFILRLCADVWDLAFINGLVWLRVLLLSVAIFLIVEAEKWAGPRFIHPVTVPAFELLRRHMPPLRHWSLRCIAPIPSSAHGAPATASESTRIIPLPQLEPLRAQTLPGSDLHIRPGEGEELVAGGGGVSQRRMAVPLAAGVTAAAAGGGEGVAAAALPPPGAEAPVAVKRPLGQQTSRKLSSRREIAAAAAAAEETKRSARQLALMEDVARNGGGSKRVMDKDWSAPLNDAEEGAAARGVSGAPRQFEALPPQPPIATTVLHPTSTTVPTMPQ